MTSLTFTTFPVIFETLPNSVH